MPTYHLAQLNIGRVRAPLTDPVMADFVNNLDAINALAEDSAGFVWRLKGDGNDATSLRPFDDEQIIVNMSVWENVESLRHYVYRSAHTDFLRRRKEWFDKMDELIVVLWWVPAGHTPTVAEAKARLLHLREHGDTVHAFGFKNVIAPVAGSATPSESFQTE